jgi:flagella basal body P-ring formation protein FlgA
MVLLLAFTLSLSAVTLACEINLPANMVVVGTEGARGAIQMQECQAGVEQGLSEILEGIDGSVSSQGLIRMLEQRGHAIASLTPATLKVRHLKNIMREQLELPAGIQVQSTRANDGRGFLALEAGDRVEVYCPGCLYGPQQPMQLIVTNFDGAHRMVPMQADFRKMVRAYRVQSPITAFSELGQASSLKEEYVESIPHIDLVSETDNLRFYKSNKPLRPGTLLRQSDLQPIGLVRAGLKTEVILENQAVRIKTSGISRSNGSIGELVEVYQPQKNKKYQGKVIDVNKILVEL